MEFKSILSDELICRQTAHKETPGYALELKRIPRVPAEEEGRDPGKNRAGSLSLTKDHKIINSESGTPTPH